MRVEDVGRAKEVFSELAAKVRELKAKHPGKTKTARKLFALGLDRIRRDVGRKFSIGPKDVQVVESIGIANG